MNIAMMPQLMPAVKVHNAGGTTYAEVFGEEPAWLVDADLIDFADPETPDARACLVVEVDRDQTMVTHLNTGEFLAADGGHIRIISPAAMARYIVIPDGHTMMLEIVRGESPEARGDEPEHADPDTLPPALNRMAI